MSESIPLKTYYCTGCKERQDTIDRLQAELAAATGEIREREELKNDMEGSIEMLTDKLSKVRALCAEAAEQFNRCYDPAMVSRLAAAGRGEGTNG